MNPLVARNFLTRCFEPGETIAFLLRRVSPQTVSQRIVTLECALQDRYLAWLTHENHTGASVYVSANPLLPQSRKRTKEAAASVRHLYLDIDNDGDSALAYLLQSSKVPSPNAIINTSPHKYQVIWKVEGFSFADQEHMVKLLAIEFRGDPACTDRNRVLRIPGFLNCKYDPPATVTVEYPSDEVSDYPSFELTDHDVRVRSSERHNSSRSTTKRHSHSEMDWAWVVLRLTVGVDPIALTIDLADQRSDKSNPQYYAARTVDVASATLSLNQGKHFDDVVAELDLRRRSELPAALCSARAREIATTAQRIVARSNPSQFNQ